MVCDESIRVSRVSRVRVRFSNVLRVGVAIVAAFTAAKASCL